MSETYKDFTAENFLNAFTTVKEKDSLKKTKKREFICRLCGHDKFIPKTVSNGALGPSGRSWVEYCICSGCGVHFSNPEKFSKC